MHPPPGAGRAALATRRGRGDDGLPRSQRLGRASELASIPSAGAITVTKRGQPALSLVPWDLYESLSETLEILSDADLTKALRRSITEACGGRTILWEKVRGQLD